MNEIKKIGMYSTDEILEFMTEGEGQGFLGRSMFDAMYFKINDLQSKIDKAIEFIEKENKICYTNKTTDDPQKVIGNFMWHTDKLLDILKEDK